MATIHPSHAQRTNPKAAKSRGAAARPSGGIWLAGEQYCCERGPHRLLRVAPGLPEPFDAVHGKSVYMRAAWDSAVDGLQATRRAPAELDAERQNCLAMDELE